MIIIPIGVERPLSRTPIVTYYLMGLNFLAFFYTFYLSGDPEWVIDRYGLVPSRLSVATFFTAMFLHGGWGHILGNMLYLWIYGRSMEDRLGKLRYVLLYLAGGLAADALHIAVTDPHLRSSIPSIGASGAISAVLGAFLLSFPGVKIRFFYYYWIFIPRAGRFYIAAWAVLGLWFLKQALFGAASGPTSGGIAFFAHIGGFLFGFLVILAKERLEKAKDGKKEPQPGGVKDVLTPGAGGPVTKGQPPVGAAALKIAGPTGEGKMPEDEEKTEGEQEVQEEWKVRFKDGTVFAPVTYENLVEWYNSGQIDAETPVAENALTAEWVTFKDTEGFAVAKAAKEGETIFCTSCGAQWPVGTKFCTQCGTNLETGEKILGAGEKKPERVLKLRKKGEQAAAEQAAVAEAPADVGVPAVEEAVPAEGEPVTEAPAAEAAEVAVPGVRKKRGGRVVKLVVALAVVVIAVRVLAPEKFSDVVDKVKGLVGLKKKTVSPEQEREDRRWAGVSDDVRAAIEGIQEQVSTALTTVPFSQAQRGAMARQVGEFLKQAVEEFTEDYAFLSLKSKLAEGDLGGAADFLKEEKSLLGAEVSTPGIDAIQGVIEILRGREKEGIAILTTAAEDGAVVRVAADFCRGAVEGCLERLLPPQGRRDVWTTASEILGVEKESLSDEFLARRCGAVLAALPSVQALTTEARSGVLPFPEERIRTKAFVGLFNRWDPLVQTALVELGKTDPGKRPSVLNYKAARVAYALRLMSEEKAPGSAGDEAHIEGVLKEGLSADPENAFFNYARAIILLEANKDEEATREIVAGNAKPDCEDYVKERMMGMAKVLDSPLPYTVAMMKVSCPHFTALASASRRLLDSAASWFRVGRREEAFETVGEWREACERLRKRVCTFEDGLTLVNAAIPLTAAESDFYRREGKGTEAWEARRSLAENWRLSLAVAYGAEYGLTAEVFVREVLSEEGVEAELAGSSPKAALTALWERAAAKLDTVLKQDPARTPLPGVNLQEPNYVAGRKALNGKQYEAAFGYASVCLTRNPGHLWSLKVMEEAVTKGGAAAAAAKPRAVAYRVAEKRDLSLGSLKRLEYELEVAKDTTNEQAIETARTALQGFVKRENPDALRIYVMLEGNPLPRVRLNWAPGGDWAKAKRGTPASDFREDWKVFE